MACKHEVLKPGGYVECSLEGPGVACIASDSDLTQRDCDCYEEEEEARAGYVTVSLKLAARVTELNPIYPLMPCFPQAAGGGPFVEAVRYLIHIGLSDTLRSTQGAESRG